MRVLEKSIPLSVKSAWSQGARNDYAKLPSILHLAETAARHPMILQAIGSDIALKCNKDGYTESTLAGLRAKVMVLCPVLEAAKATVDALKQIAVDFASEIKDSRFGKPPAEIPGLFTSGITEAILLERLNRTGYVNKDITEDAYFYKAGKKMSARNMDFVWARQQEKRGAIYECKNQPSKLVQGLMAQNTRGHEAEWLNSELWLMLEVHHLLVNCHWKVSLSVVTLRPRGSVQAKVDSIPFIEVPGELAILCLEDLSCPL